MKTCNKCNTAKALTEFFKDKGIKDGHATICKQCKQANTYAWRDKNRDKYNSDHKKWAADNYQRLRLNRYKLTPEQYAQMLLNQKGVCAVCSELPKGKKPLVIDHNHDTLEVRGLLCYKCNRDMNVVDDEEQLAKLISYRDKKRD